MKITIIPVTPFEQNASLLICSETNKAAIIDPGGDVDKILAVAAEQGADVEKILLTHAHIDHVGGTQELAKALNVPVEGPHKDDSFWLQQLPMQGQMFGFPQIPAFEPQRWLDNGDTVTFGNVTLQVFHTPGHTPGHVVFYHPESANVFVGDVLFNGSIGRTDFPRGDLKTLLNSIKTKLWTLPDDTRFYPGHSPTSTIGHEKKTNPFIS